MGVGWDRARIFAPLLFALVGDIFGPFFFYLLFLLLFFWGACFAFCFLSRTFAFLRLGIVGWVYFGLVVELFCGRFIPSSLARPGRPVMFVEGEKG